jgi:hypothetical protein
LNNYKIEINEIQNEDCKDNNKTGIWSKITNLETCKTIKKRIWWKDGDSIMHDGTTELPIDLRELVDNAWLEYSRKTRLFK